MNVNLLLQGIIIGFAIAAPVGPIGVLCIRRTLAQGLVAGLVSGLGAATADAVYGCIAGFGLTLISSILVSQRVWLHCIGGFFLCYLGCKTFMARPVTATSAKEGSRMGAYTSTFFLTLTNPMTILSFTTVFAGLGIGSASGSYAAAGVLVLGVFIGSALWWLLLSSGVSLFRTKFSLSGLQWVNRIAGIVIVTFGLMALMSL